MLMLFSVVKANTITALRTRLDRALGVKLFKFLGVNCQFACSNYVKKKRLYDGYICVHRLQVNMLKLFG